MVMDMREIYEQLEEHVLRHLEDYFSDLEIDRSIIEDPKNMGMPWIHVTRACGTYMILLRRIDQYPKAGETVPYLFGWENRETILNRETLVKSHSYTKDSVMKLWLYFDGEKLKTISPYQAREIVQKYYDKTLAAFQAETTPA